MGDVITMSNRELSRIEVCQRLVEKRLKQAEAASLLSISVRHLKRLLRAYKKSGAAALASKRRGQPSNHRLPQKLIDRALSLIRSKYPDFGPTLACEKLAQAHHLKLSVESVRQVMIAAGLWQPRRGKAPRLHQSRQRRACLGELCQLDGSPHDWFEGRAPRCTLLVFIDDATSRLMHLGFVNSETTFAYFEAVGQYLRKHGKPQAFYSDKYSVFRPSRTEALNGSGITQFGRAMAELDIEIICANTPQAKGRVERVNQTLQDRLVKELRLQGISSIAEANAYAEEFIRVFNAKFAVEARSAGDAHRSVLKPEEVERVLRVKESRVLSKNLELSYKRVIYQIRSKRPRYALRYQKVWVYEAADGEVEIEYKGKRLEYRIHRQQPRQAEVADAKQAQVGSESKGLKKRWKRYVPAADSQWRRFRLAGSRPPKPIEKR
jgi:transposase